jgi:hypothetical protein
MSSQTLKEQNIRYVDLWNVGIRQGSIECGSDYEDKIKRYLRSVGITLYLDYDWRSRHTEFIMVKTSEADVVPNPLESA